MKRRLPFVHAPDIGQRNDTLLDQLPQHLDRGTLQRATIRGKGRSGRGAHRLGLKGLHVPFARHGGGGGR